MAVSPPRLIVMGSAPAPLGTVSSTAAGYAKLKRFGFVHAIPELADISEHPNLGPVLSGLLYGCGSAGAV